MIAEARAALLAVLETAGVRAYAEVPDRGVPPMAIMVPSEGWVVSGEAFGEFVVSFDVEIIAPTGTNVVISQALDDAVETVLIAISNAPGMYTAEISKPASVEIPTGVYLGSTITVKQNLQL
jgi:hypothetical protein